MTVYGAADCDPFDAVLSLEDEFYTEGFDLGYVDGERAGRIEGRAFGIEKGFEKFLAMGKLHGGAAVWAGRLNVSDESTKAQDFTNDATKILMGDGSTKPVLSLPASSRLASHIKTLYALTETETISTENTEAAIAGFDDRLKRAEGKVKVIEKLTGESSGNEEAPPGETSAKAKGEARNDGSIEDTNVLHARH